jgi:hypothetical protein
MLSVVGAVRPSSAKLPSLIAAYAPAKKPMKLEPIVVFPASLHDTREPGSSRSNSGRGMQ